jgi:hypothetical protein
MSLIILAAVEHDLNEHRQGVTTFNHTTFVFCRRGSAATGPGEGPGWTPSLLY